MKTKNAICSYCNEEFREVIKTEPKQAEPENKPSMIEPENNDNIEGLEI